MISFVPGYFGFLGNQMFQYAAVRALSLARGVKAGFPANKPNLHALFPLKADLHSREWPMKYRERGFHFFPDFWDAPDGTQLHGYFQSEKYFAPHAAQIRQEFSFEERTVFDKPTVAVHVRRGDYLSFPEHHPPLTMDYYSRAMERFPGLRFLVFSDDPGWCLLNFDRERCRTIVGQTAIQDMALMASCDHFIIANSSFSWWGAWLGRNPEKRVVAPAKWFGPAKAGWDTRDLYCTGWEVL